LTDNKKGSCTHFDSAAALLCRSMGIPARYCEGFVIKEEDVESFPENDGYTTVSVPDSRAHAWVEVYIDGYGWLPFEATPGYGNMILELNGSENSFDKAPVSELTSVSTEAPLFSENPAVTKTEGEIETEVVLSETALPASEEKETSELTDKTEISYGEGNVKGGNGAGEEKADTSVSYVDNELSEDITESNKMSDISQASETEENGSGELAPRKEIPRAVIGTVIFIGTAAVAFLAVMMFRRLAFRSRQKRLRETPHKAAGHMYRMLLTLSGEENAPEKLAESLEKKKIPKELTETVVNVALKARFGGGIDISEAESAYGALRSAMTILNKDKSGFDAAILWITARDKYM
ncbi:MAG: transglutaminase family protein, partial [Huintestinicola sp.]